MESTDTLDVSVSVPLKVIDSGSESASDFPRLDALKPEAESSGFHIRILDASGGTSLVEASASETVADIKRRVVPKARSIELVVVAFAGEILDNERTLSECRVASGSELSILSCPDDAVHDAVTLDEQNTLGVPSTEAIDEGAHGDGEPISDSRGVDIAPEAEIRGLVNKARAQVLYDWNGVTSEGQSLGLPLRAQDFVMVGRVVNKDWYEGYLPNDFNRCGHIPRNYVEIDSLYDEEFGQKLGSDGHNLPILLPLGSLPPRPPPRRNFLEKLLQPAIGIFGRKKYKQQRPFPSSGCSIPRQEKKPPLPPSPFPPKPPVPILDLFEQGSRVRLDFHLDHGNPEDHPIVKIVLSLVSAPQARITYATVELAFEHDTIIDLEPKREESAGTEVHYSKFVSTELSATGGASYGPAELLNLTANHTESKLAEYSRLTRGTVVGDGIGSSKAYWVFKEDFGEAGRFGLDSEQKMSVALHVRPIRVDYQINARVVMDDGRTGGWFNTKRLSSGRQRYYFRA